MPLRIFLSIALSVTNFCIAKAIYPSLYSLPPGKVLSREYQLTYYVVDPRYKIAIHKPNLKANILVMELWKITETIQRIQKTKKSGRDINKLKVTYSCPYLNAFNEKIENFVTDLFRKIDLHAGFNVLMPDLPGGPEYKFLTDGTYTLVYSTKKGKHLTTSLLNFRKQYNTLLDCFTTNEYFESNYPTIVEIKKIRKSHAPPQQKVQNSIEPRKTSEASKVPSIPTFQKTNFRDLTVEDDCIPHKISDLPDFIKKGSPITPEIYKSMLNLVEGEKENDFAPLNKLNYSERVAMLIKYLQGTVQKTLADEYNLQPPKISRIIKHIYEITTKDAKTRQALYTISQYKCRILGRKK